MKKQQGFGVVGIILVVVAVALIGWRAYEAGKSKSNSQGGHQTSGQDSTQSTEPNSTNPNGGQQTPAASYLDIKELGVKIKLDSNTQNDTYVIAQTSNDGSVYIIDPALEAIDNGNKYCAGTTAGMIGLLDRATDPSHWSPTTITVNNTNTFKLGTYYYVFRGPQAECSQDTSISQQRATAKQNFLNVLPTLQLDK